MSTSGISALSSLSQMLTNSAQPSNQQQIGKTVAQLFQDIQSGNLPSAQSDLSTLTQQLSSSQTGSSSQTDSQSSPLGQLLTQLGNDLGSGNISKAQTAVRNFLSSQQSSQGPSATSGHHHHHRRSGSAAETSSQGSSATTSASSTTDGNSIVQDIGALFQNIQSGNLTAAQSAYTSLTTQLGQSNAAAGSGASSNGVASVSSAQTSPLQQLLGNLGNSLSSGNIGTAQLDLQSFFQTGNSGNGLFVTADA